MTWPIDPTVYIGLAGLFFGYALISRGRLDNAVRPLWFLAGLCTLWLALETPIDPIGDRSLQSMHMFQHVLLGFVAPPLLVLGLSPDVARLLVGRVPGLRAICGPAPALAVATIVMIFWHLPGPYNLTTANEGVHVVEHLTFIAAGVILWWPVLEATGATLRHPLNDGLKLVYLLLATVPQDAVALVLQFSREIFYSAYAHSPQILSGWTPAVDQNMAGVVLQLLGKVAFLAAGVVLVQRWLKDDGVLDEDELAGQPHGGGAGA
ncbi:MAG: cytochrome c oxidase assembly protein [Candidatus Dormibacteraeota bacterium]|nr:cytochrome c oxidase assembly protein [Candidatus Dormibacteraeota bacterium]